MFEIENLEAAFFTRQGVVKAVNGVSLTVKEGETLALVGESGSGKSVTLLTVMGLLPTPPLKILSGEVKLKGQSLRQLEILRKTRGNEMTMIFQEPMSSLNPYLRIGSQLIEPLTLHRKMGKAEAEKEGAAMLKQVGISDPDKAMRAYPHEFSGGMRQRVMIAMSLLTNPRILLADEPTTALDVTVQAQVIRLLKDLQKKNGMGMIFVTHDLGLVAAVADRVAVMYAGKIIEEADVRTLFSSAHHPYTKALLRCTPRMDRAEILAAISGAPPDLSNLPRGCAFFERCPDRMPHCEQDFPKAQEFPDCHRSSCFLEGKK